MDIGDLAERAKGGDRDAFGELFLRYRSMVTGVALARTGDATTAEDVTQQVFLTAWQNIRNLQHLDRIGGWLATIARYESLRTLRNKDTRIAPLSEADTISGSDDLATQSEAGEGLNHLLSVLQSLRAPEREAAVLYYLHSLSQVDVASLLGIPVTTVNNRLRNARRHIRNELENNMDRNDGSRDIQSNPDRPARGEIISTDQSILRARLKDGLNGGILTAFTITDSGHEPISSVEVIQMEEGDLVRCVPITGDPGQLEPGMSMTDTGGPVRSALNHKAVERILDSFDPGRAGAVCPMVETGIRAIDLFTPLPERGRIALVGDMQSGKMVLVEELIHRLSTTNVELTIFVFVDSRDEIGLVNSLDYRSSEHVSAVYLPVQDASALSLRPLTDRLDATIALSKEMAARGHYPAIDVLQSSSTLLRHRIVSTEHVDVVRELRAMLESTGLGGAAHLLSPFRQPFFVAEHFTRLPGESVPYSETLSMGRKLLSSTM